MARVSEDGQAGVAVVEKRRAPIRADLVTWDQSTQYPPDDIVIDNRTFEEPCILRTHPLQAGPEA